MRPACVEAVMAPVRTGLRRGRITTLTAAVVCLTVVTALLAAAPPAAAATRIAVDAGWAGGDYVPGRPLPVRVDITADRLLTGSLHVAIGGDPVESVTLPVEVPGGTTKRFVVVLAGPPQGDFEVTARVSGGDEGSGTAFISSVSEDVELVGLLPGLVEEAPGPVPLAVDVGTARFTLLTDAELGAPGALAGLGTVVAPPDGVQQLGAPARANLLDWVAGGGFLVVDAPLGTRVAGLPDAWQPGEAGRVSADRGEVRLSDGRAAAGRWSEVVEPTPLADVMDLSVFGFMGLPETLPDSVARDGGLRVPELGWLALFLIVYLVLAGPLVFLVLRRLGRSQLTWVALPLVAVLFAVVAFVVGDEARRGSSAAHASMIESGPAGARVTTHVGLVSRNGADGRARFPAGWHATGYRTPPMLDFPGRRGGAQTQITTDGGRPLARLPLDAGGFGLVTGRGPGDGLEGIEAVEGLEVTATAAADGSLHGIVRNGTELTLHETMVLVGRRSAGVGRVEPGESLEWRLDPGEGEQAELWEPAEAPWREFSGWDGERIPPDGLVNYALWSDELYRRVDAYRTGDVLVAGWTREWAPPVDAGGPIQGGRTVLTARAPVEAAAGPVPAEAVRRDIVRGPRSASAAPPGADDFGPAESSVIRFVLPVGVDPTGPLTIEGPGLLRSADVWVGDRWVPVTLEAGDRAAVPVGDRPAVGQIEPVQPEPGVADPFNPHLRRWGAVPAGAVQDRVVYVRVAFIADGQVWNDVTLRGAR